MTTSQTKQGQASGNRLDEIITTARDYLAAELRLDPAIIRPEEPLRELPGADSVHLLRVIANLERHYDLEFDDESVFGVSTLAEVASLIVAELDGSA